MLEDLAECVLESIKSAAKKLTGRKRREFQAETTFRYCDGNPIMKCMKDTGVDPCPIVNRHRLFSTNGKRVHASETGRSLRVGSHRVNVELTGNFVYFTLLLPFPEC